MNCKIKTVVIPAAGRGSRLLPATKTTSKELMNVYDRSTLQYAIDEAVDLDVNRIVVVINSTKNAIREYLSPDPVYINELIASGKPTLAAKLTDIEIPEDIEVIFVEQAQPLGLGHAVLCAAVQILPGPFAVLLPDDLILGTACLSEMSKYYKSGHMVAAMDVDIKDTKNYGMFHLLNQSVGTLVSVSGMVEKPLPDHAPSKLAAVGRYILDHQILNTLKNIKRGAGGEFQLTDAIEKDAQNLDIFAFRFSGTRYDCGSHDGLLSAAIARQGEVKQKQLSSKHVA